MTNGHVLAGHDTARVQACDRTDRDQRARLNLAAFALDQDDPAQFLGELLAALGLDKPARRAVAGPLLDPADGKYGTGGKRRTTYDGIPPHGSHARYGRGCHCSPCDQAGVEYRADLKARKQAER